MIEKIKKNKVVYSLGKKVYVIGSYSLNKSVLSKNLELKNKYQDERCFIIGNGTSINRQDLTKLKNEFVFVCNHFYFHNQINEIKPTFYSMIEPILAPPAFIKKMFPATIQKIDSFACQNLDTTFFFNIQYKKYIDEKKLFLQNKVHYLLFSGGGFSDKMNLEMSKPNPSGRGSIYFMLSMAWYLGFKRIYILGCDADYILDGYERHFYGDDLSLQRRKSNLESAKMLCEELKMLDILKRYFEKEDVRVFNAGKGGFLDVFERADYESVLKNK